MPDTIFTRNVNNRGCAIGFFWPIVFTILFIFLKVFNLIAWSWVWVFAPIWGTAALIFAMFLGIITLQLVLALIDSREERLM